MPRPPSREPDEDADPFSQRDLASYRQSFEKMIITDSLQQLVDASTNRVKMSGAEVIYRMLKNRGVKQVFGYSGGAVLPLVDCFHAGKVQFYLSVNEQCAGHSAQAVGKATGRPGVAVVTSGPGLTGLITPLQDAMMDGVPMIAISGQVPTTAMGTDAFQECPATALTKPCTKWNYLAQDVESLPWAIEHAFKTCMSGRKGPVHIDLPKNVAAGVAEIPLSLVAPRVGQNDFGAAMARRANDLLEGHTDAEMLARVADLINRAKRPVLLVGQGGIDAPDEIRELAEKADLPTTTTVHAMGVFDELHPLSLHMLGMHGAAYANFAMQNADLIVSVGSRFDDRTTGITPKYAPKAREAAKRGEGGIVHIDVDSRQFGKTVEPDFSLHCDARNAVRALLPLVRQQKRPEWTAQVQEWKEKFAFSWVPAEGGKLKTQQVIEALYRASTNPRIVDQDKKFFVTTGVGNHQMMACQFFRWREPRQMLTSGGLGTMGVGLPFAIGCQVAHPDANVLLIDGDGSFNMTSVDLASVVAHNLPVKIAIMNDRKQQMVAVWQKLFFKERFVGTDNVNPDYVKLAESWGIKAVRAEHKDELDEKVRQFLSYDGPIVGDFRVEPDICLPMVQPGKALDEMLLSQAQLAAAKMDGLAPS